MMRRVSCSARQIPSARPSDAKGWNSFTSVWVRRDGSTEATTPAATSTTNTAESFTEEIKSLVCDKGLQRILRDHQPAPVSTSARITE